jgi:hypothetical protein
MLGAKRIDSIQFYKRRLKLGDLMAHACIPSYSGGRDQEDKSLKPALTNSS